MEEWYHTIWGVVLLGAIGSILGALLLKATLLLVNKLGPKIIMRFSSNLLIPYAENRHFVHMCEQNNRPELIAVNYSMTMSKYTRTQIVFIITIGILVVMWVSYFASPKLPIVAPLLFTIIAVKDFYDFIKWYLATSGCLPDDMKTFGNEIKKLKKEDRYKFIENALKQDAS